MSAEISFANRKSEGNQAKAKIIKMRTMAAIMARVSKVVADHDDLLKVS